MTRNEFKEWLVKANDNGASMTKEEDEDDYIHYFLPEQGFSIFEKEKVFSVVGNGIHTSFKYESTTAEFENCGIYSSIVFSEGDYPYNNKRFGIFIKKRLCKER